MIKGTYFLIGNKLFLQCIGIPMGIDPAPFWANLHLYSYEYKFITSLMGSDKGRAMKFRNASRFIETSATWMTVVNLDDLFARSIHLNWSWNVNMKVPMRLFMTLILPLWMANTFINFLINVTIFHSLLSVCQTWVETFLVMCFMAQ